ncbi:MAG: hypothetical protein ABSF00_13245, partial [Candidatus Bathyarchaeia archaeon]
DAREYADNRVQVNILMEITCRDHVLNVDVRFMFGQRAHPSDTCLSVQLNSWAILEAAFLANSSFSFLDRYQHSKLRGRMLKVR